MEIALHVYMYACVPAYMSTCMYSPRLFVCMYVCMYVCMSVCMYPGNRICSRLRTHVCWMASACIHVCMYAYIVCMHVCLYVCVFVCLYVRVWRVTWSLSLPHKYPSKCVYTCVCGWMCVCVCVCVQNSIRNYTGTQTMINALTALLGLFSTLWVSFVGLAVQLPGQRDLPHVRGSVRDCLHISLCDLFDLVLYASPGSWCPELT